MKKILFVFLAALLSFQVATDVKASDYLPDKGYGMMSRKNVQAVNDELNGLRAQVARLTTKHQTGGAENGTLQGLVDKLSTRQKYILTGVAVASTALAAWWYFGDEQPGTELVATVCDSVCEQAEPVLLTIYQNVTKYVPQIVYRNVTQLVEVPVEVVKEVVKYMEPVNVQCVAHVEQASKSWIMSWFK